MSNELNTIDATEIVQTLNANSVNRWIAAIDFVTCECIDDLTDAQYENGLACLDDIDICGEFSSEFVLAVQDFLACRDC